MRRADSSYRRDDLLLDAPGAPETLGSRGKEEVSSPCHSLLLVKLGPEVLARRQVEMLLPRHLNRGSGTSARRGDVSQPRPFGSPLEVAKAC
eukprot:768156-Hanusia_phi.AAC.12